MKKNSSADIPLARNLRKLLSEQGLTIRQAAKLALVKPSSLEGWRNGVAGTDYAGLKRLSAVLNCSLSYLLTGEEEDNTHISVDQTFDDGGSLFDGYAKISIQRLLPKKQRGVK